MVGDLMPYDSPNAFSNLVVAAAQPLDGALEDEYAIGQRQIVAIAPPGLRDANVEAQKHPSRTNPRRPQLLRAGPVPHLDVYVGQPVAEGLRESLHRLQNQFLETLPVHYSYPTAR